MKKKIYETPVVEITNWMSEDIITASGISVASTLSITTANTNKDIASVSYNDLAE